MKQRDLTIKILVVVILFCGQFLVAQGKEDQKIASRIYTTAAVGQSPPQIDGKLDDAAWRLVPWSSNFTQWEPYEGKPPSQKTAFKIIYDNNNLYVAIRAYDTEPHKIVRRMSRRDNFDGDWVEINIDSYHDLRTAFSFTVNAAGVKGDEAITNDGHHWDSSWDPIWYVKTSSDDQGWVAEMRIPYSQLRFAKKAKQVWGLQVQRRFFRKNERSIWQFIPRNAPGWVHQFGKLQGISGIKPQRMYQIMPYGVARYQSFQQEIGNPFSSGSLRDFRLGLDGKFGISSNLTMDLTINPDFGQVEADPSVVNLTAFETFFAEKRPFFIEGKNILNYQITSGGNPYAQDNLFYSRRIGRSPQYYPDLGDDEYADIPENTTILGAMKLTGKTPGGLSIGILESVTSREQAQIDLLGERRFLTVEPLTNYFLARIQKDINMGTTIIGAMLTATHRNQDDEHLRYLHSSAYSGGLDVYHTWKKKAYYVSLKTVFSRVQGTEEAIEETQTSSRRYYQRPDADHLNLDPQRTSLSGHGGTFAIGKQGGKHWFYSTGLTWRSPGLELNDLGYMRQADSSMQWLWIQYRITDPFAIFRRVSLNFNQWTGWNFNLDNLYKGANVNFHLEFKNHWSLGLGINRDGDSLSISSMRGGPALKDPGGWNTWFNINSDNRQRIRFNFSNSNFWGDADSGRSHSFHAGITIQPSNALRLSLHPGYNTRRNNLQYVSTETFNDQDRFLFGFLDQKTLSVTIRLNFSITPDLSIQFYGQPFFSTGKYTELKRITNPRDKLYTDRFQKFTEEELSFDQDQQMWQFDENRDGTIDYSVENPDFNFLQFRSNLVIRWEYTPGSTVYLIWSQGRTDTNTDLDFNLGRNFRSIFEIPPHNVFLIKFTYNFKS